MFFKLIKIHEKKIYGGFILFFLALNFIIWSEVIERGRKPELAIYFFDVGQGDSILIESKDGAQILIDGGPPNRILPQLSRVLPYFDRYIDVVILTHPHADHISGLIEVFKKYNVGMLIESGASYSTAEFYEFEKLVEAKGIKKILVDRPASINFSSNAKLKFLYPDRSFDGENLKNVHDSAIISELDFEGKKILFMADAEKKTENHLVSQGVLEDIDVLKAGHHGSKTSSNAEFLKAIKPEYAVISVGAKNRYGHPSQEALSRFASLGAKIFRTDLDGTIRLEIRDGNLIWKK